MGEGEKDNNDVRHSSKSFVRQRFERSGKARFLSFFLFSENNFTVHKVASKISSTTRDNNSAADIYASVGNLKLQKCTELAT